MNKLKIKMYIGTPFLFINKIMKTLLLITLVIFSTMLVLPGVDAGFVECQVGLTDTFGSECDFAPGMACDIYHTEVNAEFSGNCFCLDGDASPYAQASMPSYAASIASTCPTVVAATPDPTTCKCTAGALCDTSAMNFGSVSAHGDNGCIAGIYNLYDPCWGNGFASGDGEAPHTRGCYIACGENQHVRIVEGTGTCVDCAWGSSRPAGDPESGPETSCTSMSCTQIKAAFNALDPACTRGSNGAFTDDCAIKFAAVVTACDGETGDCGVQLS